MDFLSRLAWYIHCSDSTQLSTPSGQTGRTRRVEKLLLAPANDGWREMVGAGVEGAHPMPIVSLKSWGPPRQTT